MSSALGQAGRSASSAPAPARRRPALTLAERIALQEREELHAAQASDRRTHPFDSLDAAAEASLEHAVVTPDGGLGAREGLLDRPAMFAAAPRESARRASSLPLSTVGRSPSALPPPDSDPVSIQDLAQMLSPGIEPPPFSTRGVDAAGDERAGRPAPMPEAVPTPRASTRAKVPVRPPARREHRATTAAAPQRPVQRATVAPRPAASLSEMPPLPLSEMPPSPLSSDESRPSSPRSAPELRPQDVQAMGELAPNPQSVPPTRRTRVGLGPPSPEGASSADFSLLESLAPSSTAAPPPLPASPRAAEEPRREAAKPTAAEAQRAAGEPSEQGSSERPSGELAARTSGVVGGARAAGDRAGQAEPHARADRKESSGLIDLRSMSQPPGAEDGDRRSGAARIDEEILSISSGLFEGAAQQNSSPVLAMPSGDLDLLTQDGHGSEDDEAPVETPARAGPLDFEGLRALVAQAWRQHAAVVGWVLSVFVVFGAAMYFTMSRGRSRDAATASVDAAASGALAAASPEPDGAPALSAAAVPAGDAGDREPSLDDEPIADPPAADPGAAGPEPAASAAALPDEPAAPPAPEPAQAGAAAAPGPVPPAAPSVAQAAAAPRPTLAVAPSPTPTASPSAAPATPAPSAAPVAGASAEAGDAKPESAAKPAGTGAQPAPDRPKTAAKPSPPSAELLPVRDEPARFDTNAASSALASAAAVAAECPGDGLTGTARVAVTFSPSGKTMSARVEGGDLVGTPVAGCIAGAFRNLTVPPFEGIPVTVMKQVKIR